MKQSSPTPRERALAFIGGFRHFICKQAKVDRSSADSLIFGMLCKKAERESEIESKTASYVPENLRPAELRFRHLSALAGSMRSKTASEVIEGDPEWAADALASLVPTDR